MMVYTHSKYKYAHIVEIPKDEIRKELSNEAITYGIDERQLDVITQTRNVSEVLIAKGDPLIEDEEDKLDIKFEDNIKLLKL